MLRISTALAFAAALTFQAAPALADDNVGCGWGTMIFEGSSGLLPNVGAATTNAFLGNQTFGISSGSLGCNQNNTIGAIQRQEMFVAGNIEQLAMDMAMGGGETLSAFAQVLEIEEADRASFYSMSKSHFVEIFSAPNVSSDEVLDNVKRVMATDQRLARYAS